MSVNWGYYDKFDDIMEKYLPDRGEGDTMAQQIVTAVTKLVYKWYNDGDVYDNVHSCMDGWCNDLSSYANWLSKYAQGCSDILIDIYNCVTGSKYENILRHLADSTLNEEYLSSYAIKEKTGTIYDCTGKFEFSDQPEDDYDDEYEDEDEYDEDDLETDDY